MSRTERYYTEKPIGRTYEDKRQWEEFMPWPVVAGDGFKDSRNAARPERVDRRRPDPFGISVMGCAAAMVVASR